MDPVLNELPSMPEPSSPFIYKDGKAVELHEKPVIFQTRPDGTVQQLGQDA